MTCRCNHLRIHCGSLASEGPISYTAAAIQAVHEIYNQSLIVILVVRLTLPARRQFSINVYKLEHYKQLDLHHDEMGPKLPLFSKEDTCGGLRIRRSRAWLGYDSDSAY